MIIFPNIDPVIFSIGPISIRWYSLAYILGVLFVVYVSAYLDKNRESQYRIYDKLKIDDIFLYGVLGIVLGGRLGYVLFYDLSYYLSDPKAILFIWKGGMSFHGAMIGVIFSCWLLSKKNQLDPWLLWDYMATLSPFGLFIGRITNFINAELYGRITDVRWGVLFPNAGPLPRHPSQLYQSLFEGLFLLGIMLFLINKKKIYEKTGVLSALFLILYGVIRFFIEFYREADIQIGYLFQWFTMGQVLCFGMIICGSYILKKRIV